MDDLNARIAELEAENRDLEERRQHPEIPAIDREILTGPLDEFERVMAEGTNPQEKDLLRRLVKKVLVHDRRTIEIRYGLQSQASVRTPGYVARRKPPRGDRRRAHLLSSRAMRTLPMLLSVAAAALIACQSSPRDQAGQSAHTDAAAKKAGTLALPFIADNYAGALAQAKERDLPLFIETWAPW